MTREQFDTGLAGVAIVVALYHKVDAPKRAEFERRYPRVAALIGIIAAIVPFLPLVVENGKRLIAPSTGIATPGTTASQRAESVRDTVIPYGDDAERGNDGN